jgi:DNA repair exonuclease SbcCD ATPase subunit
LLNISKIEKKILEVKKSSEQESNLPILEKKLLDLKVSFEDIEGRLNITTGEILENEQLQYHFGTKGFKTYLTNKVIKTIETFINFHLSKLNTNLSVRINGYKKLANGDVRDKIETFIVRNGVSVGKYARYSGGQKERINICAIIALNELNNTVLESGKGLDLLILDEQLDGLDDKGRMEALNILQQKKMTTIVVSHLTSDLQLGESFKRVVVRYKNGISKIS